MALQTTNFGLIKPQLSDPADITAFNANWDKIDDQLKKAGESGGSDITGTELDDLIYPDGSPEDAPEEPIINPTIQLEIDALRDDLSAHINDKDNPHEVTADQIGALTGEDVVDNLLSTRTDLPLSANQGNVMYKAFRDGCDTLVGTCTACESTPASNSPDDISDAIIDIYNKRFTSGREYFSDIASKSSVFKIDFPDASNNNIPQTNTTSFTTNKISKLKVTGVFYCHNQSKTPNSFILSGSTSNIYYIKNNVGKTLGTHPEYHMSYRIFDAILLVPKNTTITLSYTTLGFDYYNMLYMDITDLT